MAHYDYKCESCQKTVEREYPIDSKPTCPACDSCGGDLVQVYSSVPVVYRGDGWTPRFHKPEEKKK